MPYRSSYLQQPETAYELGRAEQAAKRLTDEEPWVPWW